MADRKYTGPGSLRVIAAERGEALETLIPRLLAEHRTPFKVAIELGVYPNTIRYWMERNADAIAQYNATTKAQASVPEANNG